jgi:hypothetical protein
MCYRYPVPVPPQRRGLERPDVRSIRPSIAIQTPNKQALHIKGSVDPPKLDIQGGPTSLKHCLERRFNSRFKKGLREAVPPWLP